MNSKEKNIKIEVKIAEERITLNVPFSKQNEVRATESEIRLLMKELTNKFPGKGQKEILAMATYHYASFYFSLVELHKKESEAIEDLLEESLRLCNDDDKELTDEDRDEFDVD